MKDDTWRWDPLSTAKVANYWVIKKTCFLGPLEPEMKLNFFLRLHGCIYIGVKRRWLMKDDTSRWDPLSTAKVANYRVMKKNHFLGSMEPEMRRKLFLAASWLHSHIERGTHRLRNDQHWIRLVQGKIVFFSKKKHIYRSLLLNSISRWSRSYRFSYYGLHMALYC